MPIREAMNRSARDKSTLRARIVSVLAGAAAMLPFMADALPVIPNAAGFGVDTPAGRGGKVYKVTNLNDSGEGSLRACVSASGPRVCVFEVSGTIRMPGDLTIRNPNITIAGQTAPAPGIMLRGGALRISASDVLVQHLRVRPGDDPSGPAYENRDALKIEVPKGSKISNIVIDHCSFSWATDEVGSLWNDWDNVTLSNNIFAEGLYDSPLRKDGLKGGYGLLVGPVEGKVTIVGNLLANNKERNPLTRGKELVFVNNVVYNQQTTGLDLQSEKGIVTNNTVMGNVFIRGADTGRYGPVTVRTKDYALPSASRIFVADNRAENVSPDNDWSIVSAYSGTLSASLKTDLPPTWPAGLTRLPTANDLVLNTVLRSAGARPADRDSVDKRIVQSVRDGTGRIVNCVSPSTCSRHAHGWPTLEENRRTLTLPSDPNAVTPSGYTKLELWLHEMAAEVEGRSPQHPIAPVLASE